MVFLQFSKHFPSSGSSCTPDSSFCAPKCCSFSHESFTFVRPRVAEEPLRKCPSCDKVFRSFSSLEASQHVSKIYMKAGMGASSAVGRVEVQCRVHFREGAFCLSEEVVDYAFAEFALFFVVVHFKDLYTWLVSTSSHPRQRCSNAKRTDAPARMLPNQPYLQTPRTRLRTVHASHQYPYCRQISRISRISPSAPYDETRRCG